MDAATVSAAECPYPPTVGAMEKWMADRFGAMPRVADRYGDATFQAVHEGSAAVAKGLLATGLVKGSRVGLLLPNGRDYIETLMGILRVGGQAVLISTLARPPELAYMILHADIDTLIAVDTYLGRDYVAELEEALPSLRGQHGGTPLRLMETPFLRRIRIFGERSPAWSYGDRAALDRSGQEIPDAFLAAAEEQVVVADPAVLIFTSGSTAAPKAVLHSQGNMARQAWRMSRYMAYEPGDRLMTTMPFFWIGGLCTSMLAANLRGAAIVCPARPNPAGMVEALDAHGVTHAALWPQQLGQLVESPGFGDIRDRLKPTSAQQLGLFGLASPERTPNSLGMTETFGPHSMEYFGPPLPADRERSFGRAVGDVERRVIDPATGEVLPPGVTGELILRGGSTMIGFYRRERSDVFDADGFYHTGDLGWLSEDGHFFFAGRRDDVIKIAGANVSPREVEQQLGAHPDVAEAIVAGIEHAGEGLRLVAAVVPRDAREIDEAVIVAWLRERLAGYKVPRRIVALPSSAVPRTASQKVNGPALRALLARMTA